MTQSTTSTLRRSGFVPVAQLARALLVLYMDDMYIYVYVKLNM